MTAAGFLASLRACGATVAAVGDRLRIEAPAGMVTQELREALAAHKPELIRLLSAPSFDPDAVDLIAGTIAAVLIRSAVLDGALLWLVADADALAEHPDILRAGLPVFFFDEVEQLRGKTPAELKAIAMVKAEFPTSRVLQ
jgi:hypothetical protein